MTPLERAVAKVHETLGFALRDGVEEREGHQGSFGPQYGVMLSLSELSAVHDRLSCDGFCMGSKDEAPKGRHPVEQG